MNDPLADHPGRTPVIRRDTNTAERTKLMEKEGLA